MLGGRLVLLNKDDSKSIAYSPPKGSTQILVGSDPKCHIRLNHGDIRREHFHIYSDAMGKIKIGCLHSDQPIIVNDEPIERSKFLRSGDIISILHYKMRWETKSEPKRNTELLCKTDKKQKKTKCMKTKKRFTIHSIDMLNKAQNIEQPLTVTSEKPILEEEKPEETPFSTPMSVNKENFQNSPKLAQMNLNMSGTLLTSYSPSTSTRSSSRQKSTPEHLDDSVFFTPAKDVLGDSSTNLVNFETPKSKVKKSMYLIDLTTPQVSKTQVASSSALSPLKKTPLKVATVFRNENVLLKSALKNSTIQKTIQETPKRKTLCYNSDDTPISITDISSESYSPSTIELSSRDVTIKESEHGSSQPASQSDEIIVKTPEEDPSKPFLNYTGVGELLKTPAPVPIESDEDFFQLMKSISSALVESDVAEASEDANYMTPEIIKPTTSNKPLNTIEKFEIVVTANQSTESGQFRDLSEKFNQMNANQSQDNGSLTDTSRKFDELVDCKSESDVERMNRSLEAEEKGQEFLKWIEGARDSLKNDQNQSRQVASSRYSNITPNDSISNSTAGEQQAPQHYDASTPKISILQIEHMRKSVGDASRVEQLAFSPVAKLSCLDGSTEVMENYQLSTSGNNEMQKSLRSTKKHFGNAMRTIFNMSQLADTTFDGNDSIVAVTTEPKTDFNESKSEVADILSLDDQLDKIHHDQGPSNHFIEFATSNDHFGDSEKNIVEINSDDSMENNDEEQTDESEVSTDDDDDDEGEDEEDADPSLNANGSSLNFRLSAQDLVEGIVQLDDSKNGDAEEVLSSQESDVIGSKLIATETHAVDMIDSKTDVPKSIKRNSEPNDSTIYSSSQEQSRIEDLEEDELLQNSASQNQSEIIEMLEDESEEAAANSEEHKAASFLEESVDDFEIPQTQALEDEITSSTEDNNGEEDEIPASQAVEDETKSLIEDDNEEYEIPATQSMILETSGLIARESVAHKSVGKTHADQMYISTENDNGDFEIPETQAIGDSEAKTDDHALESYADDQTENSFGCIDAEPEKVDLVQNENDSVTEEKLKADAPHESALFSDTEFSRVDFDPDMVPTDSDESPGVNDNNKSKAKPESKIKAASLSHETPRMKPTSMNRKTIGIHVEATIKTFNEAQKELRNVDEASSNLLPDKDSEMLALSSIALDENLTESFSKHSEFQNELMNIDDKPSSARRDASLAPEPFLSKVHTPIPDMSLSESFVKRSFEVQKEMVNIDDEASATRRRASNGPEETVKTNNAVKTLAPTALNQDTSLTDSLVEYVETQKELVNVSEKPTETRRGASEGPEEVATKIDSRKTLAPISSIHGESLSGSFVEYVKAHKKLTTMKKATVIAQDPSNIDASMINTSQQEISTPSVLSESPQDENNSEQAASVLLVSDSFRTRTSVKIESKESCDDLEEQKKATLERSETPSHIPETSSRRRVRVNYALMASGSTPKKAALTPSKTPRRGRSDSIEAVSSVQSLKLLKEKPTREKVEPVIAEEPIELLKLKEETIIFKASDVKNEIEFSDKVTDTEVQNTPSRRGNRVNYVELLSGSTPKSAASSLSKVKTSRIGKSSTNVKAAGSNRQDTPIVKTIIKAHQTAEETLDILIATPRRGRSASIDSVASVDPPISVKKQSRRKLATEPTISEDIESEKSQDLEKMNEIVQPEAGLTVLVTQEKKNNDIEVPMLEESANQEEMEVKSILELPPPGKSKDESSEIKIAKGAQRIAPKRKAVDFDLPSEEEEATKVVINTKKPAARRFFAKRKQPAEEKVQETVTVSSKSSNDYELPEKVEGAPAEAAGSRDKTRAEEVKEVPEKPKKSSRDKKPAEKVEGAPAVAAGSQDKTRAEEVKEVPEKPKKSSRDKKPAEKVEGATIKAAGSRGRKQAEKVEEVTEKPTKSYRGKKPAEKVEEASVKVKEVSEKPTKSSRGKKPAEEVEEGSAEEIISADKNQAEMIEDVPEKPKKPSRGKKPAEKVEASSEATISGDKKQAEKVEEVSEKPTKSSRSKKPAEKVEEAPAEAAGSRDKKRAEEAKEVSEKPTKSSRGKKDTETVAEALVSVKRATRGKKQPEKLDEVFEEPIKSSRGRKQAEESSDEPAFEKKAKLESLIATEPTTSGRRVRGQSKTKSPERLLPVARRGRAKSEKEPVHDSVEEDDEDFEEPEKLPKLSRKRIQSEKAKKVEAPAPKLRRGNRKAQLEVDSEPEEKISRSRVVSEPEPPKKTRGKQAKAEVPTEKPESQEKRGRGLKAQSVEPSTSAASKKKAIIVESPPKQQEVSKPSRTGKRAHQPVAEVEEPATKRSTRNRK